MTDDEIYKKISKTLVAMCFRNAEIESIHAGRSPVTKTGDYSDVVIIDADGNVIPWNDIAHIPDSQMKMLIKSMVNKLYTFFIQAEDLRFCEDMELHYKMTFKWDEPEIDPDLDCTKRYRS